MKYLKSPSFAALLAVLMWACAFPATKYLHTEFSAFNIVLFRNLVASIFFLILFCFGKVKLPKKEDALTLAFIAITGLGAYQLLFANGVFLISPAVAAVLISLIPIFIILISTIFLKEKITKTQAMATILGFFGIFIMSSTKGFNGEGLGYLFIILASIFFAIYSIFQKKFLKKYNVLDIVAYNIWIITICLSWNLPDLISKINFNIQSLLSIAFIGIFSSSVAFILWFWAIHKTTAHKISLFLYIQPIFVAIISWYWLHDMPSSQEFLGGAIILFALLVSNIKLKINNKNNKI